MLKSSLPKNGHFAIFFQYWKKSQISFQSQVGSKRGTPETRNATTQFWFWYPHVVIREDFCCIQEGEKNVDQGWWDIASTAHYLKITQNVAFEFWHFPPIFCPIKTDLSGNTVWPQASGFQKFAKMDHFWHF